VSCGRRPSEGRRPERWFSHSSTSCAPLPLTCWYGGQSTSEADIRKGSHNDLGAAVVAILPILATRMRGRRPSAFSNSATIRCAFLNSSALPLSEE